MTNAAMAYAGRARGAPAKQGPLEAFQDARRSTRGSSRPALGFLVHHRFRDLRQRLVGRLLFLQRGFQQLRGIRQAELLRPRPQRAVARDLVVLHRLRRRQQAGVERGRALLLRHDLLASSMMPMMASQVLPCGLASIASNTCSRRVTWPSVSPRCFSNAARSLSSCAAFAIFGSALRIFFSAK